MTIKNIIFDLGGVILNINYQLTIQAFHRLGATHFAMDFTKNPEHAFFYDYETGKITSEQFRDNLRKCLCLDVSDNVLDDAWNAMLLDLPKERLAFLQDIKKQYRTFLFSNTNAIHIDAIFDLCRREHQVNSFNDLFERAYYSHTLGLRKPDQAGFLKILHENKLEPHQTVFVDDLYSNIVGAQKAGLQGVHLVEPMTILQLPELIRKM